MNSINKKDYVKPQIAVLSSSQTDGGGKPKDASESNGNGIPGSPGNNPRGTS